MKKIVIVVAGKMRSGKNTFGSLIGSELQKEGLIVKEDAFANTLKDWCAKDFKILTDGLNTYCNQVNGEILNVCNPIKASFNELEFNRLEIYINSIKTDNKNWYEEKNALTRSILQIVGTDLIRKRVDKDFWIKEEVKKIKSYINVDVVIITDARFPNECELLSTLLPDYSIITIKVNRDTNIKDSHISETALDNYKQFTYEVDNNGTIETLKQSVQTIVKDIFETEEV